ncbi:MAG: hypothetical protein L6437_01650, partial [Kiritimatiellae bacterium]|nr:hypothetical protein [Kiritimatiellia bacterium]
MMNKTRIALVFVFTLILLHGALPLAGEKRVCNAYLLKEEPVLDGKIDGDPAWKNIISTGEFSVLNSTMFVSKQTYFRVGYTPETLYIGIECMELEKAKIKAQLGDMGNLWGEDSVEIFFQKPGETGYYQFIVNAIGSKWSSSFTGPSSEMTTILPEFWTAKTHIDNNCWCAEIKIPFEILKTLP